MTEEINGIFIRNDKKPKIHLYELYHESVRKFEYLYIQYKINIIKLIKDKHAFENNTLDEQEHINTYNLNKKILNQKNQLDKLIVEVKWLYDKIVIFFPVFNNCICKGQMVDNKWKIEINYKSI